MNLFFRALIVSLALGLTACQSGKKIDTVDDSADYRSARALPPLKKPDPRDTDVVEPVAQDVAVAAPESTTAESANEVSDQQQQPDSPARESLVLSPAEMQNNDDASSTASKVDEAISVESTSEPTLAAAIDSSLPKSPGENSLEAANLTSSDDSTKLEIPADFDSAWAFLTKSLVESELTVFSRNKEAGRISIGCGEIAENGEVEVKRAGGWSIFNRRKAQASEYCSLQAEERKGQTVVSVLNRSGQEVGADYGRNVLNKILNN